MISCRIWSADICCDVSHQTLQKAASMFQFNDRNWNGAHNKAQKVYRFSAGSCRGSCVLITLSNTTICYLISMAQVVEQRELNMLRAFSNNESPNNYLVCFWSQWSRHNKEVYVIFLHSSLGAVQEPCCVQFFMEFCIKYDLLPFATGEKYWHQM